MSKTRISELEAQIKVAEERFWRNFQQQRALNTADQSQPGDDARNSALRRANDEIQREIEGLKTRHANLVSGLPESFGLRESEIEARLAQLEKKALTKARYDELIKGTLQGVAAAVKDYVAPIQERITAIEKGGFRYCGVHQRALSYKRGDVVTYGGSLFSCVADETTETPGTSEHWQLAVKRGSDGRNAA